MPDAVDRAVVTVAEATTDFVGETTATDFAVIHQDDAAIDSHLDDEVTFLSGSVGFLLSD